MKKGFGSTFYLCLTFMVTVVFIGVIWVMPSYWVGFKELAALSILFVLAIVLATFTRKKMKEEEGGVTLVSVS